MADSLPDDAVRELLVRMKDVPVTLFRSATVCKRWLGLVADPSFLRRCWLEDAGQYSSFSFPGFVVTNDWSSEKGTKRLVPALRSALGPGRRALSSFVPAVPAGEVVPLVSRRGLLLVRLGSDATPVQLAVCDLHAGKCHMLPPLNSRFIEREYRLYGYAVLTATDCRSDGDDKQQSAQSDSSSLFKVVIFGYHDHEYGPKYHLHTFSSDQGSWSMRNDCFQGTTLENYSSGSFSDVVVRHGTAYWLFYRWEEGCPYMASLNTRTEHFSLTKLAFPSYYFRWNHSRPCLILAADKTLSVLQVQGSGTDPILEIWGQRDQQNTDGTSEWLCTRTIRLKLPVVKEATLYLMGEKCGTLLLTHGLVGAVYTADLETGTMVPGEAVPLEMDWTAIFVSRLCSRYS